MSLTLQEIYETTKSKYQLNLITPLHALQKVMNWVYIGEDITTFDYLNGGELVITTGLCIKDSQGLYDFIHSLIQHECCGLIINIGEYLTNANITPPIRQLCVKHDFALFTMPWKISFQSITKDYYHRIFQDSQTNNSLTEYFLSILRQDSECERSIMLLDENGFRSDESYCICVLNYHSITNETYTLSQTEEWQKQLLYSIDTMFHGISMNHHIILYKNTFVFICCHSSLSFLQEAMNSLLNKLTLLRPHFKCRIGVGSVTDSLTDISISYKRAVAALTFADYYKTNLYTFADMGFYRLLLSVHDVSLLDTFLEEQLGTLMDYDKKHNSNYVETLYQYLMQNGSIQAIATAMFCHRNTVNYRIKNLKELLNLDLDDMAIRFDFLIAFSIKKYLEIL